MMNSAVIKWFLTRLLSGVLLSAVLLVTGWRLYSIGYDSGHKDASADGNAALASEQSPCG
ncbi:hypothetical protein ACFFW8_18090 [Erwinia tracheiphila]